MVEHEGMMMCRQKGRDGGQRWVGSTESMGRAWDGIVWGLCGGRWKLNQRVFTLI